MNLAWFLLPIVVGAVMVGYALLRSSHFNIECDHRRKMG